MARNNTRLRHRRPFVPALNALESRRLLAAGVDPSSLLSAGLPGSLLPVLGDLYPGQRSWSGLTTMKSGPADLVGPVFPAPSSLLALASPTAGAASLSLAASAIEAAPMFGPMTSALVGQTLPGPYSAGAAGPSTAGDTGGTGGGGGSGWSTEVDLMSETGGPRDDGVGGIYTWHVL